MNRMSGMTIFAALFALLAIVSAASTVDGDWNLSLTAPEGATYFKMTIAVDGESASGTVGETAFGGSYRDGNLKLTGDYYVPEAGYVAILDLDIFLKTTFVIIDTFRIAVFFFSRSRSFLSYTFSSIAALSVISRI